MTVALLSNGLHHPHLHDMKQKSLSFSWHHLPPDHRIFWRTQEETVLWRLCPPFAPIFFLLLFLYLLISFKNLLLCASLSLCESGWSFFCSFCLEKSSCLKALLIHYALSWCFLLKSVSFFPHMSTFPGVCCHQILQYGLNTQHSKARPTELRPLLCLGPGVPINPSSPCFYVQLLLMFAL